MNNPIVNNEIYDDAFLSLLSKPLDQAQSQALKTKENSVIAAGAGSGKTQVLATRFAWLILTGQAKADQILTLTFTNKAAAEMYQRIYKTLYFFSNAAIPEKQKELAVQALKDFANAHIQTLDSYSASIVRQCANRYGIKPDFTTGSADSTHTIKQAAFSFVLARLENPAVKAFAKPGKLQEYAEDILAAAIIKHSSLASEKNYFSHKFSLQLKTITEEWKSFFLPQSKFSNGLIEIENELNNSDSKNDSSKANYVNSLYLLFDAFKQLDNLKPITEDDIIANTEKNQDNILLVKKFIDRFELLPSTGKIKEVQEKVSTLKDEQIPRLKALLSFVTRGYELKAQMQLFDDFLEEINNTKRVSGQLTFADVSEMALKILKEQADIRNQEKRAYKKIMIDEFQDNNGNNRDLLYILALKDGEFEENGQIPLTNQIIVKKDGKIIDDKRVPGKLFFVGDEKQSIYRFRGADVSVFNELTQSGENTLIPMTYNYRSSKELVKAFNLIFENGKGIFEVKGTVPLEYEAYYSNPALKNGIELPELDENNVPIHFALSNSKELADNKKLAAGDQKDYIPEKEQVAYFIAKKIAEEGSAKQNWSDFAILDRTRTDRAILTKYLSLFNIPYELDQAKDIFTEGLINDFYNFLRLCVYPKDINACAAYLASPFCGFSLKEIEKLIAEGQLNKGALEMEADGGFFKEERPLVLQRKLTDTLTILWHLKGYKYETMLSQEANLCAEHFDMLFELARLADSQGKSLAWFIDQLEIIKKSFNKTDADMDAEAVSYPLERKAAVKIMTIHKSKGLQFNHVFLYGCLGVDAKADKEKFFFDDNFGLVMKTDNIKSFFQLAKEENTKSQELAEFRRLIYVGITRAIDDVYITGSFNPHPENSKSNFRLIENMAIKNYIAEIDAKVDRSYKSGLAYDYLTIHPVEYQDLAPSHIQTAADIKDAAIKRYEKETEQSEILDYQAKPLPRSRPSALETDANPAEKYEKAADYLQNRNFTAADFGTLVHSYLEAFAKGLQPEAYEADSSLYKNLSDSEIAEKKAECISFVHAFEKSQKGQELIKAKEEGRFFRAEWAFRAFLQGTIYTGAIDLIYENPDKSYTIVDYKSDAEIDLEKYRGQQECYRTAAAKILKIPEEKIDVFLYFLRHNKTMCLEKK